MPIQPDHQAGAASTPKRLWLSDLAAMRQRGEKIAVVTAYDAPSARLAEAAGIEILLVGDSAAMTVLGYDSTLPVTVEEMLMLTGAVARAARRAVVVADLPFGSFQVSDEQTVAHSARFVKEAGAHAVKLEGAGQMLTRVRALVGAGIPVMGHIGLTPQSAMMLGGYVPQGRTAADAFRLREDAIALQHAGCFSIVIEAVPPRVAERITEALDIPTIGIGCGPSCDGQVLVWHDLMGLTAGHTPRFVKRYAELAGVTLAALEHYVADVRSGRFPEPQHTYGMPEDELRRFEAAVAPAASLKD